VSVPGAAPNAQVIWAVETTAFGMRLRCGQPGGRVNGTTADRRPVGAMCTLRLWAEAIVPA
jgi:hypothetical protein